METREIPPPGADRDAEIARALGWATRRCPPDAGIGFFMVVDADGREVDHWLAPDSSLHKLPPAYSTDPAACDRLVEAMRQRFWCLSIQVNDAGDTSGLVAYGANFYKRRSFARDAPDPGGGVTMSDAVSAAALLALRGGR